MEWTLWGPHEDTLTSIMEMLQDALIPDSEIQKDVQTKLKNLESAEDFTYYLLYIIGQTHFSEDIRSLSGILLKNNISSVYNKLSQESIIKIRQLCLIWLQDSCRDVRSSISSVIQILVKDKLKTWPELVPFLVALIESRDECNDAALTTLFGIFEELMNQSKIEDETCMITKEVFPKFVDLLSNDNFTRKTNTIKLINQSLQGHSRIMKVSIDLEKYLRCIIQLADTDDVEMQKYICHTFVIYIEYREESLLPHLHDVIVYLMVKTQHTDTEVALVACEFWLALTKLPNCKEILCPYIDKLIPILLKNMKYSTLELIALKDTLRIDEQNDGKTSFPFHMHNKVKQNEDFALKTGEDDTTEDEEEEEEDYLGNCDDVDDYEVGWTLRKCSAASLDVISLKFGPDILPIIVPFLNQMLYNEDLLTRESAILALGAISEGCVLGLKNHLPLLTDYLIQAMSDEHSMIRVITCWTISRYVGAIISMESESLGSTYFVQLLSILLKHFMDDNRRVQRAALSAFCVFEEEAHMRLLPHIDLIIEGFQLGFQKFNPRSLYVLYEAINVLAHVVGRELSKPQYVDRLITPLLQKLQEAVSYEDDQFIAALDCLCSLIPALDVGFLPYSEMVYGQCIDVINDVFMAEAQFRENCTELEPPRKDQMQVAIEVLHSMALSLKMYFRKFVVNSHLVGTLYTTMQDCSILIRQSSIALYGELFTLCYPYMETINVGDYIKLLVKNLDVANEKICKISAYVLGRLGTVMGHAIKPFCYETIPTLAEVVRSEAVSRGLAQVATVSICILFCSCPDAGLIEANLVLKNCCLSLRGLRDTDEKHIAFRGLCNVIVLHADFLQTNFLYFCDAVASWSAVKPDLRDLVKEMVVDFRKQCGEGNWAQFFGQFPDNLQYRLNQLYGI